MKNINIQVITQVLTPLMLDIQKSSARRRFLRLLNGYLEDLKIEQEYLRKEFGEKNPDGSVKTIENIVQFTKENRLAFNKKAKELDNLEIPIDFTGHEQDIETIKSILSDLIKTEEERTEFDHNNFDNLEVLKELKEQLK